MDYLFYSERRFMKIDYTTTYRGFKLIKFNDLYDKVCNIQESSLATDDAIWIGVQDAEPKIMASKTPQGGTGWVKYDIPDDVLLSTRMHLNREQVKQIIPILQQFVDTGEIPSKTVVKAKRVPYVDLRKRDKALGIKNLSDMLEYMEKNIKGE